MNDDRPEIQARQHPLFPAKSDDEEAPLVGYISIARWSREKSCMEFIPRMFAAEEIQDLSQIAEMFGGGRYELIGRNANGNKLTARRQYDIAGKPRPLVVEPADVAPPTTQAAAPQVPPMMMPAATASGPPAWIVALLPVVLPIVLEYLKSAAAERQMVAQQTHQMMVGVMNQQQQSSQAFITAMSQLHAAHSTQGTGSRADFMAGIEFMENMLTAKMEEMKDKGGDETGEIMKTIGQAFEGLKLLQGAGGSPAVAGGVAG